MRVTVHTPLIRLASMILAAGVLTGMSLLGAMPASAATASDCTAGNTLDAASSSASDIQLKLDDPTVALICLSGTFSVTTILNYQHSVTLFGLPNAVLQVPAPVLPATGNGILTTAATDTLRVQNLRFTGGRVPIGDGGAIYGDTVTVVDSTFDDNQAGHGGAIYSASATIMTSTFTDNTATSGGGAIVTGQLTLNSSTFDSNSAGTLGGAIAAEVVDVTNSTFVGSSVSDVTGRGATLVISGGTVQQSTFRGNLIDKPSGGQAIWASGNGLLVVRGNIFADDNGRTEIAIDGTKPVATDEGGNLFTTDQVTENYFTAAATVDASTHFGLSSAAIFGSSVLADNGGTVQTIALPANSIAINAVPGASTITRDARGATRTAPNDAGAFEYVPPTPALAATGAQTHGLLGSAAALLAVTLIGGGVLLSRLGRRATAR
jgi:predicted outer membrane repeat protein